MQPTPIDELRKPHPDQKRIDAEAAELLRATALQVFRRKQQPILVSPSSQPHGSDLTLRP